MGDMRLRRRQILRAVRLVLLLAAGLLVALFLRGHPKFTIPGQDTSLEPTWPAGATVLVRRIDGDDALARGDDVVYEMEKDGKRYARFGRVRALPGDVVGVARGGVLTVNGEPVGPLPLAGPAAGEVPPGHVYVLAVNPLTEGYPDSRRLGFIPRDRVAGVILSRVD